MPSPRGGECVGDCQRRPPRLTARFHQDPCRAGGRASGGADGSGNVDGVAVRRRRYFLGVEAWRRCSSDGRSHRVAARHHLCSGRWALDSRNGSGCPANRRERRGGGLGCRGPNHCRFSPSRARDRSARTPVRSGTAWAHGRISFRHCNRIGLHDGHVGGQCHDHPPVHFECHFPWGGRCGHGHAHALDGQYPEHGVRSLSDFRRPRSVVVSA